jgi:hypothetical protein
LRNLDLIFVCLYRQFPSLLDAIILVTPETLLRWHHRGFRAYWRWKSWRSGLAAGYTRSPRKSRIDARHEYPLQIRPQSPSPNILP